MSAHTRGGIHSVLHEERDSHQQRELRHLGLLTSPKACDAEVPHKKENMAEYALAAWAGHR